MDPGGPLSDAEVQDLVRLLARFAEQELDQWENWRIDTSYGPVYALITRGRMRDWPDEAFTTIWPLPAHLAEKQARVGGSSGWTVWRQDDNGNRYEVSRHGCRADADSMAETMEARGHKQTYWVAPSV